MPDWPGWVVIPLAILAGFVGGAFWGAIPGALKAYFGVNEILSTVMMNAIAVQIMNYLLRGPMIDPAQAELASKIPQTAALEAGLPPAPAGAHSPAPGSATRGRSWPSWSTSCCGAPRWAIASGQWARIPTPSRYGGIRVRRQIVIALLLSGAFAGLAGAIQVYGLNYRMITDGSATGFTGSAGFNGIVAALFGQLHPLGTIPASFFFGALLVGANKLQRVMQVPSSFILALNGLVVIFVVSSEIWRRRRQRKRQIEATSKAEKEPALVPESGVTP